jgi:hypothetical protein
MDWLGFFTNMAARVPFERILIPPRDGSKELEKFYQGLAVAQTEKKVAQGEGVAQGGSTEGITLQPASDFCPACGPEKHIPIARNLLVEAGERFSDGKLTPDGIVRIRNAVAQLRTYTDTDLGYIEAEGPEREFWQDLKDAIIEIAHELGTSGKGFTIGQGTREQLEKIRQSLEKVEAIAYEGVIRFGRKEVKHAG